MTDANVSVIELAGTPGKHVSSPQDTQSSPAVCPPDQVCTMKGREQGTAADEPVGEVVDGREPPLYGRQPNGTVGGHKDHSRNAPKPVEVTSVPETSLNNSTPAGGTPRCELIISQEPASSSAGPTPEPSIEPIARSVDQGSKPAPVTPTPPVNHEAHEKPDQASSPSTPISKSSTVKGPQSLNVNETSMTGTPDHEAAVGEKRALERVASPATSKALTEEDGASPPNSLGVSKKRNKRETDARPNSDDAAKEIPADPSPPSWPKAPRNKEERKKLGPVGRTARQTRSQGPVQ